MAKRLAQFTPQHGGPKIEFFQSSKSMEQFEKVVKWLNCFCKKDVQSDPPTKDSLSKLIISYIQFQEKMLGKNATEPPLMRLPMRCFLDFRPGGSLCHIICTMYRFKVDQCLESFEFDLTEHHHLYMEMSKKILENLINQKCFPWPTIYFQPEFDDVLRDQLTDILKERQCEITEDENLATHIIYPEIECSTDDYARPLFKQGNNIMIHWYYLPESYDSFVTDTFNFSFEIPETFDFPSKTWHVSAKWVQDSKDFNEWMSEEDYEVDANGKRQIHRHRLLVEDLMEKKQPPTKKKIQKPSSNKKLPSKSRDMNMAAKDPKRLKQCSSQKMPVTNCPDCKKEITIHGLPRHRKEEHGSVNFKCSLCEYSTKRESLLLDHQRRKHFEPVKLGRPPKNGKQKRERSPFRVTTFKDRHSTSIKMIKLNLKEAQQMNNDQSKEMGKMLEEFKADNEKNHQHLNQRLKVLENSTDNEFRKTKTRLSIIEGKQKDIELPNVTDIPGLLSYFNLTRDSTKDDIRTAINFRLMEISPESLVSKEIYHTSKMSEEKRDELVMFYNQANTTLLKWKKQQL